ncbi:lysine--tRNA ligase [Curtanaerobium respiraculi]|uniref:lysine--tRNA ligase n=1 Tax=Curtanaerobium respiraculi TaxID=2949669 RepID=UPI0024B36F7F|nr:lysine--tRNA ligase [Curtanaerobium respiraculi]
MAEVQNHAIEDDPRQVRLNKRSALLEAGAQPYGHAYDATALTGELAERYAGLEDGASTEDRVKVAGRVMAIRNQGKIMFLVLRDREGDVQLFCRVNELGDESFASMKDLDVGDWIGAEGTVMRTKRGELSVRADGWELLSKSIRPLPEKFHGLSDKETRYRQRYVDMAMNPDVKGVFIKRSRIISAIRRYMEDQGYLEVETPILQETLGGANAKPFTTHFNALDQECYLRIATELHLKRLLVGGMDRVFEIGRQFRNEGMDLTHNPEFTSMEAYCAFSDVEGMKRLTEGLFRAANAAVNEGDAISYQGKTIEFGGEWRSVAMTQLVSEHVGEDVTLDTPVEQLRAILDREHLEWDPSWGAGKLVFVLYDELCESEIVNPTFVCDYPVEVSPLAKRKPSDPRLTDRFELVIAGHEYANAFSELNDPVDQERRFIAQVEAKAQGDDEAMEYDADYIRALEYGMPPAGGIGYGIDRMIMLLCDQASIRDVLLFPHMRPEAKQQKKDDAAPAAAAAGAGGTEAIPPAGEAEPGAFAEENGCAGVAAPLPGEKLDAGITRDAALDLLKAHNKDEYHIQHGLQLEALMRYYAREYDSANEEFWGIVGLLHDLDWEEFPTPAEHTLKAAEMLAEAGANPLVARCLQTHNADWNPAVPAPEHQMEKVLFAIDELSGLVNACVLVRPSHSVLDMNLKSLKKKFKSASFAAGCDRENIARGAELLGIDLNDLFSSILEAEKTLIEEGNGAFA